jgi:hypothetical protein
MRHSERNPIGKLAMIGDEVKGRVSSLVDDMGCSYGAR